MNPNEFFERFNQSLEASLKDKLPGYHDLKIETAETSVSNEVAFTYGIHTTSAMGWPPVTCRYIVTLIADHLVQGIRANFRHRGSAKNPAHEQDRQYHSDQWQELVPIVANFLLIAAPPPEFINP